jgi:hypothetical protein
MSTPFFFVYDSLDLVVSTPVYSLKKKQKTSLRGCAANARNIVYWQAYEMVCFALIIPLFFVKHHFASPSSIRHCPLRTTPHLVFCFFFRLYTGVLCCVVLIYLYSAFMRMFPLIIPKALSLLVFTVILIRPSK